PSAGLDVDINVNYMRPPACRMHGNRLAGIVGPPVREPVIPARTIPVPILERANDRRSYLVRLDICDRTEHNAGCIVLADLEVVFERCGVVAIWQRAAQLHSPSEAVVSGRRFTVSIEPVRREVRVSRIDIVDAHLPEDRDCGGRRWRRAFDAEVHAETVADVFTVRRAPSRAWLVQQHSRAGLDSEIDVGAADTLKIDQRRERSAREILGG